MPTNLGALKSDELAPTGRVQIKRGVVDTAQQLSNVVPAGTKYNDGAGGFMQISVTPRYDCRWIVKANMMCHQISNSGTWERLDFMIAISPNDVDGRAVGVQQCTQNFWNNNGSAPIVEWRTYAAYTSFRLAANTAYTASIQHAYSSGWLQTIHTGHLWCRILGRVVGEAEVVT